MNKASVIDLSSNSCDEEHGKPDNVNVDITPDPTCHESNINQLVNQFTFCCLQYPACDLLDSRAVESYVERFQIDILYRFATTHQQFQLVSSVSVLAPGLKEAKSSEREPLRALLLAAFSDCLSIDWAGSVSGSQLCVCITLKFYLRSDKLTAA